MKKIPVIIDTDPGVDDALALKIAFGSEKLDIRLVCSVAGNVNIKFTTANALFLTKRYGGDIPVVQGCGAPLSREATDAASVHGANGIGNYTIPDHSYTLDEGDGVEKMNDCLTASNEKVTLITLGPLTNIATLLDRYPKAKEKIEKIYAMVASKDGVGNITPYAEFNAYCDPEALDAVIKSGIETVFAPMHLGRDTKLSEAKMLERGRGSEFGDMLSQIFDGYCDDAAGEGYVAMYDANAVEALINPQHYEFVRCNASVDTTERIGQTFLTPDENGSFFYLEAKEKDALEEAMLNDMFG